MISSRELDELNKRNFLSFYHEAITMIHEGYSRKDIGNALDLSDTKVSSIKRKCIDYNILNGGEITIETQKQMMELGLIKNLLSKTVVIAPLVPFMRKVDPEKVKPKEIYMQEILELIEYIKTKSGRKHRTSLEVSYDVLEAAAYSSIPLRIMEFANVSHDRAKRALRVLVNKGLISHEIRATRGKSKSRRNRYYITRAGNEILRFYLNAKKENGL